MAIQRHMRVVDCTTDANTAGPVVKVAFATGDRRHVDQHFGSACGFVVYAVESNRSALLAAMQFQRGAHDGNEDKLAAKIAALEGCAAVYCQAAGASAVQQLMARGIQPLKVAEGTVITDLIQTLQEELRGEPSPWLQKALVRLHRRDSDRFQSMAQEEWDEG